MKKPTKAATKGQKEIHEANVATVRRFTLGSSAAMLINVTLSIWLWSDSLTWSYYVLTLFALLVYVPCLICLKRMSAAKFNEKGALVDAGFDLNVGSGFFEYIEDLIILTGACQVLALISIYLWLIWPGGVLWVFWSKVASPWIFAPAPEEVAPEQNEKKQRKLLRLQQRAMRG